MALTPEEQRELAELESLASGRPTVMASSGLTPEEERELAELERLEKQKTAPLLAPVTSNLSPDEQKELEELERLATGIPKPATEEPGFFERVFNPPSPYKEGTIDQQLHLYLLQ